MCDRLVAQVAAHDDLTGPSEAKERASSEGKA